MESFDLSAARERQQMLGQIVFPIVPSNIYQMLSRSQRAFVAGDEWHCIVACRSTLELGIAYLSWSHGQNVIGTLGSSTMKDMLERAYLLDSISAQAFAFSVQIWKEGSALIHGAVVPTSKAIDILRELASVLEELTPYLYEPSSRFA